MTYLLKQLFNFVKLLNSDKGNTQIALGVAVGVILGFSPLLSLQSIIVIMCLFFFRIQIGAATFSAFIFSFVAFLFDPVCNAIGMQVLEADGFKPLFTTLYNMPIVPLTCFYNSMVMGDAIVGLLLAPAAYIAAQILIVKYRENVVARFKQTKAWKLFTATSIYNWYNKYEQLYPTR